MNLFPKGFRNGSCKSKPPFGRDEKGYDDIKTILRNNSETLEMAGKEKPEKCANIFRGNKRIPDRVFNVKSNSLQIYEKKMEQLFPF